MYNNYSVVSMAEPGWTVYRIRTKPRSFHLSIYDGSSGRPVAVLRGNSGDRTIDQADCAPLVGGALLFGIDPSAWVGKPLEMGKMKTSAILGVELERNLILVHAITAAAELMVTWGSRPAEPDQTAQGTDRPRRMTSADFVYPEDYVFRVERAALHLSDACAQTALVDDLARYPSLMQRFQVAVNDCLLKAHALGGRTNERR
ncbi:MAG TPA: hypothetical protein VFH68_13875 [Polyangia bacterium]|jgi:hypothetical protein|nr:hypothetical protein [Polyangia bacterium]